MCAVCCNNRLSQGLSLHTTCVPYATSLSKEESQLSQDWSCMAIILYCFVDVFFFAMFLHCYVAASLFLKNGFYFVHVFLQ